jgi:hypothetical protein
MNDEGWVVVCGRSCRHMLFGNHSASYITDESPASNFQDQFKSATWRIARSFVLISQFFRLFHYSLINIQQYLGIRRNPLRGSDLPG